MKCILLTGRYFSKNREDPIFYSVVISKLSHGFQVPWACIKLAKEKMVEDSAWENIMGYAWNYFTFSCILFSRSDTGAHPMRKRLGSEVRFGPRGAEGNKKEMGFVFRLQSVTLYKCLLLRFRLIHQSSKGFTLLTCKMEKVMLIYLLQKDTIKIKYDGPNEILLKILNHYYTIVELYCYWDKFLSWLFVPHYLTDLSFVCLHLFIQELMYPVSVPVKIIPTWFLSSWT